MSLASLKNLYDSLKVIGNVRKDGQSIPHSLYSWIVQQLGLRVLYGLLTSSKSLVLTFFLVTNHIKTLILDEALDFPMNFVGVK